VHGHQRAFARFRVGSHDREPILQKIEDAALLVAERGSERHFLIGDRLRRRGPVGQRTALLVACSSTFALSARCAFVE